MVIFHTCHLILETIFDGQVTDPYIRAPISVNRSLSLQITAPEQEIHVPWKDILLEQKGVHDYGKRIYII